MFFIEFNPTLYILLFVVNFLIVSIVLILLSPNRKKSYFLAILMSFSAISQIGSYAAITKNGNKNPQQLTGTLLFILVFLIYLKFQRESYLAFSQKNEPKVFKSIFLKCIKTILFTNFLLLTISFFHSSRLLNELIFFVNITGFWLLFLIILVERRGINQIKEQNKYFGELSEETIEDCLKALSNVFEKEKLYLDPLLNLESLAQKINVPTRTISAVINKIHKKGFNEYLNEYRINEAIILLKNPSYKNFTIAAIAYESGFNSLATFQRAFKKVTSKTPKEFLEK